jgi:glyceraldehyde 3-phosphate dehydrogenase
MKTRIAINGFGRIGRNVVRAIYESGRTDIDIVAINDLGPVETNAHLMRYDSVHGKFPKTVEVDGDTIRIEGGDSFKVFAERDPKNLPWGDLGIDIVMECTGIFTATGKGCHASGSRRQARSGLGPGRGRGQDHRLRRQP